MIMTLQNRNKRKDNKWSDKKCSYCGGTSHFKEICFQIVRYPEWYKGNSDQKKGSQVSKVYAYSTVTTKKDESLENSADCSNSSSQMFILIQKEVAKYLSNLNSNIANLVSLLESSGTLQTYSLTTFKGDFIES